MLKQLSKFFARPARDSGSTAGRRAERPIARQRMLAPTIYCQSERIARCVGRIAVRERAR